MTFIVVYARMSEAEIARRRMKMKKLLTMLVMLFTVVLLTACGSDDVIPEAGVWNDDIFVNESLGLQFQLPRGWESIEGEDLVQVLGVGAALLSDFASDEILEAMERSPIHDLYAINFFTGSTVQVMFQRLPRSARNYSSEQALELVLEGMEEVGFNSNIRSGTTRIGNYEFYSADGVMTMPGIGEIFMQMYLRLEGRTMTIVSLGSMNAGEFEDLLYFFNEPGAARIELGATTLAEESDLIGTWVLDIDPDYLLVFNPDGTGVRGYLVDSLDDIIDYLISELGQALVDELIDELGEDGLLEAMLEEMVEEFEWEIFDGVLYKDFAFVASFGVANEEWEAFIDGDVLYIESLQAPGMAYSYTRR